MEKLIKSSNGQWTLAKAAPKMDMGHSVFAMDHVNEVAKMKDHAKAKEYAHKIVDESSAQPRNKASMKKMINDSKSSKHLAFGMSSHILAHPSEGLKVVKEEGDLEKSLASVAGSMAGGIVAGAIGEKIGQHMSRKDVSVAPPPSKPTKGGPGTNKMAKEDGSEMMFSDLEQIAHHIAEIRESMKASQDSPDWVKAQITEAAQNLSSVAHYVQGKKAKAK